MFDHEYIGSDRSVGETDERKMTQSGDRAERTMFAFAAVFDLLVCDIFGIQRWTTERGMPSLRA
jgi:hypothetical protein